MKVFESSLSPKGQITIPLEVRQRWRVKAKDRITFEVDGDRVTILPARSPVDESFGAVPPLPHPLSVEEMTEIAAEEHARDAVREGLKP